MGILPMKMYVYYYSQTSQGIAFEHVELRSFGCSNDILIKISRSCEVAIRWAFVFRLPVQVVNFSAIS